MSILLAGGLGGLLAALIYNLKNQDDNVSNNDKSLNVEKYESHYDFYDENLSLDNIINSSSNFENFNYKNTHYDVVGKKEDEKDKYVDMSREYKDMFTDLVTNYFFVSDTCLFNFLNLIMTTYNDGLELFKQKHNISAWDLFFIYKGGNILRIISNDFIKELPYIASSILKENYQKYFTRSDCDFAIYLNENVDNYETIFKEVVKVSYLMQIKIKKEILLNPTKYFDFYKFSEDYKKEILSKYFDMVKSSKSINDPENTMFYGKSFTGISFLDTYIGNDNKYEGRKDICIQLTNNDDLVIFNLNNEKSELYVAVNETLTFKGQAENSTADFTLVRTKVSFCLYFDDIMFKIGGELIDVAISHKYDYKLVGLYEKGALNCIANYQLKLNNNILNFNSYNLSYLTHDLELILFVEHLPWEDKKYVKRLNRLFYLYFVNLFTKIKDHNQRKTICDNISEIFSVTIDLNNYENNINELHNNLDNLIEQIESFNLTFSHFLKHFKNLLAEIDSTHINNLNKLMFEINNNFKITDLIHSKLLDYVNNDASVNENSLYSNDFSSLIGGKVIKSHKH